MGLLVEQDVRYVRPRMASFSTDAATLLAKVPETATIGGRALRLASGLAAAPYERALAELVADGTLAIGAGRGGSIRRIDSERRQLLARLPADGTYVTNRALRDLLGWSEADYWRVRAELLEEGVVALGRGRGGSVGLVVAEDADVPDDTAGCATATAWPAPPAPNAREQAWYPVLLHSLTHEWSNDFHDAVIEQTAWQGRRLTGGTWSRPDLTAVTLRRFRLLPATFDVWTFEVKGPTDWSIVGAHEASAHGRRSTRPVLVLVAPETLEDWQVKARDACKAEAARLGVGLVVVESPYRAENWIWHVEPERHEPRPDLLHDFLSQQLTVESQDRIAAWWIPGHAAAR